MVTSIRTGATGFGACTRAGSGAPKAVLAKNGLATALIGATRLGAAADDEKPRDARGATDGTKADIFCSSVDMASTVWFARRRRRVGEMGARAGARSVMGQTGDENAVGVRCGVV